MYIYIKCIVINKINDVRKKQHVGMNPLKIVPKWDFLQIINLKKTRQKKLKSNKGIMLFSYRIFHSF